MHLYIYDDFLAKNKYNKVINKIETRITDLGLNGKIIRLNNLKNIDKAIQEEIKRGAKTLIIVGNDNTFNKVLKSVLDKEVSYFLKNIFLSFIPVEKTQIGLSLGINNYEEACNILLARRTESIKVATANNSFFLSQATILNVNGNITIDIEDSYQIELEEKSSIHAINMPSYDLAKNIPKKINPKNNYLYIYINNKGQSFIPTKKITIKESDKNFLKLDNSTEIKLPCTLEISNKNINLIVGKNRVFS